MTLYKSKTTDCVDYSPALAACEYFINPLWLFYLLLQTITKHKMSEQRMHWLLTEVFAILLYTIALRHKEAHGKYMKTWELFMYLFW